MLLPSAEGGVRAELGGGFFHEEYPTAPASHVLNGTIFAIWGCRGVSLLGDERATGLWDQGLETLASNIDRFDTGHWSRYDLYRHPIVNVASSMYHVCTSTS